MKSITGREGKEEERNEKMIMPRARARSKVVRLEKEAKDLTRRRKKTKKEKPMRSEEDWPQN